MLQDLRFGTSGLKIGGPGVYGLGHKCCKPNVVVAKKIGCP